MNTSVKALKLPELDYTAVKKQLNDDVVSMLEGLDGSLSFDFHQLLNASAYGNWLDIVVKDMVHETPKFIGLIKDQLTRVVSKNDDSDCSLFIIRISIYFI